MGRHYGASPTPNNLSTKGPPSTAGACPQRLSTRCTGQPTAISASSDAGKRGGASHFQPAGELLILFGELARVTFSVHRLPKVPTEIVWLKCFEMLSECFA
jgi:hypothetical protein